MPKPLRGWSSICKRYAGTVIAVTHDRYFLDNVAGWILELDRGAGHSVEGKLHRLAGAKASRLAIEEKQESARQKALARELEWVRQSATAPGRPRARRVWPRTRRWSPRISKKANSEIEIYIPPGPRLGERVIEAKTCHQSVRRSTC